MAVERKHLHQVSKRQAELFSRMDAVLRADIDQRRELQDEYQKAVSQAKEKHLMDAKSKESKGKFSKLTAELKRIDAVVTAMTHQKTFSTQMLGQGRPNGGNKEHRLHRYDVLERVRRVGSLTGEQNGQWEFFKTQWDGAQATVFGANWGNRFAEIIHAVLVKILHGDAHAFSEFVKIETDRVLGDAGALVAPGFPTPTDI